MKLRICILLTALAAVGACSSLRHRESDQQTLARYMDYAGAPVEQITYLGRYDSWRALGRNKLVVWTTVNDAYLLTVQEPCSQLPFAQAIGLTSTANTVHRGFDSVLLRDNDRCRIEEIRPVDYQALRAAQRAGG